MMLLVDIGNTRVKWARLQDGHLLVGAPALHRGQPLASVWADLWGGFPRPQHVLVACVAGDEYRANLAAWCHARWGLQPEFVLATAESCGVRNGYRQPSQLGVDRWLALIGAHQLRETTGQPLCVVGCGTALTVDILAADGHHLGGWIAPGLALMREQLRQGTTVVAAPMDLTASSEDFGHGTAEALAVGVRQAAVGLVMQALHLAQRRLGHNIVCVVSGGDTGMLLPLLPAGALEVPDLVLRGLATQVRQQGARQ